MAEDNLQEVPFDMSKETLKSIRTWIDNITKLSVGIVSGNKVDLNEMITLKYKMIKQLIILSTPLIINDLDEIENFFNKIHITKGKVKSGTSWKFNIPIYTYEIDNLLDECVQGIEKSLKKYFIPTIKKGERY